MTAAGTARASVAAAVVVALTTGCAATRHHRPAPTSSAQGGGGAERILSATWFQNRTAGYFIDAQEKPDDAISLYETRWWLATTAFPPENLSKPRVGALIDTVFDNPGAPNNAGMPYLANLDNAFRLARELGLNIDGSRLASDVSRVKVGAAYSFRPEGTADVSATAVAIALLHDARQPIPADVAAGYGDGHDGGRKATDTASALALASIHRSLDGSLDPTDRAALDAYVVRRARTATPPALALLAMTDQFTSLAGPPPADVRARACRALDGTSVALFDQTGRLIPSADAHLVASLVSVGCLARANLEAPPISMAGWPTPATLSDALISTFSGIRIARRHGLAAGYCPATLEALHESRVLRASQDGSGGLAVQGIEEACGAPIAGFVMSAEGSTTPQAAAVGLVGALQSGAARSRDSANESGTLRASIFSAVASEARRRLAGQGPAAPAALAELLAPFKNGPYYMLGAGQDTSTSKLFGTAVASWILKAPLRADLVSLGVLHADGLCSAPDGDAAAQALSFTDVCEYLADPSGPFPLGL